MLNILLIEADNQKSLGGSCTRDALNISNYLNKIDKKIRQKRVLTISPIISLQTFPLSDYKTQFMTFSSNVEKGDYVVIMISGHGYQKQSTDTKEKDGLDEYICYNNGIIEDNQFRKLIETILPREPSRIVCLIDTCHSGTMFDIDQIITPHPSTTMISLSACQDNQYDSCDLSTIGFGGSLTVHLLEIKDVMDILLHESYINIQRRVITPLTSILQSLGQKPDFYYI